MTETLSELIEHLERHGLKAKIVAWAHNSHVGDARATTMGQEGEVNIGQLVRERYGNEAVLIGFSTYAGTVTAASAWDVPHEQKRIRPALEGSYEKLFHETALEQEQRDFLLLLRDNQDARMLLNGPYLERAIGVIYAQLPERVSHYFYAQLPERVSHYFYAQLPEQFDAIIHFDETHAVEPLERTSLWDSEEIPETYPFAV